MAAQGRERVADADEADSKGASGALLASQHGRSESVGAAGGEGEGEGDLKASI